MQTLRRPLAALALLNLLAAPLARAQETAPAVLSLDEALQNFASPPALPLAVGKAGELADAEGSMARMREWRDAQNQLSNLHSYLANQDLANALQQARQYARQAPTPELRRRWEDLIASLRAEQKRVEEVQIVRIDAALQKASAAALTARKAPDLDPLIDELAALQENTRRSGARSQRATNRLSAAVSFVNTLQELLYSVEAGDLDAARQQLRNLSGGSNRDRLLTRPQIAALADALKIETASLAEAMAQIDPVLKRAADIALAAKKAEELDPVLVEISELQADYSNSYDTPVQRANQRLSNAKNFFQQWQNFLSSLEHGDERDARQAMRNLSNNSYEFRPIPRAVILDYAARLDAALDARVAAEDERLLSGLDWTTLPVLRARFSDMQEQAYNPRSSELSRIVAEMDRLLAARVALDAGQAGAGRSLLGAPPTGQPLPKALIMLRDAWWFDALPALTGLADLPPRAGGETAFAYVRRQLDAALAASDWARAHRFAVVEKNLLPAATTTCGARAKIAGDDPAAALGAWLLGRKFEEATQTEAAAEAYREALAAGSPPALEKEIILRLQTMAPGGKTSG